MKRCFTLLLAILAQACSLATAEVWRESYALEASGQYAQAAARIESYARGNDFALLRLAYLAYLQGKHEDAVRGYQRALEANPQSLDAPLGMMLPLMAQARWREAAEQARRVIQQSAWHYTAHVRLMACEEAEKQWKTLADHAREVARRYPSDATPWVYLGRAEAALGNTKNAVEAYARVQQIMPEHAEAAKYLQR
jgi:cytochrome c-type biogenesis protein CcmH/NrfG